MDVAEFEWAHCLVAALEADFSATGRVILQPASVAEYIRSRILLRNVPHLIMGNMEGP